MSQMIPPYISPDVKSNAEKRIFEWFKNSEKTEDWIILHSLGISKHISLIYGEIDFLVLAPKTGVFALEVKGGRVKRQEGIWYFTDKYGTTTKKSRGPFEQAASGIFSVMEALKKKNGNGCKINMMLYGYGLMFSDIVFEDDSIDINKWQYKIKDFIKRLSKNYSKQLIEKNFLRKNNCLIIKI